MVTGSQLPYKDMQPCVSEIIGNGVIGHLMKNRKHLVLCGKIDIVYIVL